MSKKVVRYTGHSVFVDGNQVKRVQTFSDSTDFTLEKLLELANKGVSEIIDNAEITSTLEVNDYGAIDNLLICLGQGLYDSTINPTKTITDADFDNASVDITVKIASDDTTIERTAWLGSLFLNSISLSYSVDGVATESYNFAGDTKRWFLNDFKNVDVYKADYNTSSQAIVSGSNLQTKVPILLSVNNEIVAQDRDNDTITLTNNASDTLITATNSDGTVSFSSGDRIRLLISGSGTSFPSLSSTPAGIGGIRKGMVKIFMYNPVSGNNEQTLRLQSATIDIGLDRIKLDELGKRKAFDRILNRPIDVSISLEVLESDLEEYAKLSGNESGFDASTLKEIDVDDFVKTNKLEIIVYKSDTSLTFANELKRIIVNNLSVGTEGSNISVNNNGTISFSLTSDNVTISGSGVSPWL